MFNDFPGDFPPSFKIMLKMKLKAWIFFQNGDARQASLSKLHGFFPKVVIILLITINYHQLNLNKNQMFCLVSMVSGHQFSHFGQFWSGQQSAVLQEKVSILARPPKSRRCRNQHSMAFQTPIANTDVYKGSFFPQTIRDWNALPDSLISSAEDAEDCVAKFTSLVRARD